MTGADFIKRVRKVGERRGIEVRLEPDAGKGSHGKLYYGTRRTVVKDRKKELKKGTLHAMIKQLGLEPKDIL